MALDVQRPGVVVPVRLDRAGVAGPTPGQARGRRWRSVPGGLYVESTVDGGALDQRIVEAVAGCGDGAAATGWAGLAWSGSRWFRGLARDGTTPLPVPVALGDQRVVRPRPGVILSEDWLFEDDIEVVDGLPITRAERSVTFEARRARSLTRAVQLIDMAAADDLLDVAALAAYTERLAGRAGVRLLRTALGWAEENAWSIQEVPMRLRWLEARPAAALRCNAPVFDLHGRHVVTPDLIDPVAGVVGEYDGVVHLEAGPRRRDLDRDELYRELGLEAVTMMSGDLGDDASFLRRLDGAYRRARARPARRSWTLEQPSWWVDTSTVARRRALDARERRTWLRYRSVS